MVMDHPVETETTSLLNGDNEESKQRRRMRLLKAKSSFTVVGVCSCLLGVAIGMLVSKTWSQPQPRPPPPSSSSSSSGAAPSTMSKYTQVQGLGFQIYTGGAPYYLDDDDDENINTTNAARHVVNPECTLHSLGATVVDDGGKELQCYIGHEHASRDVAKRIEIMKDAVERSYQLADASSSTLKVFIAPEFYWRGLHGAYQFEEDLDDADSDDDDCGPICLILRGMEDIVADERFQDWLFVFGTIVASEVLPKADHYDYMFYNFAPVYKGYNPNTDSFHGRRFLVPKRYVSSSDFLTPKRHLNLNLTREVLGEEAKVVVLTTREQDQSHIDDGDDATAENKLNQQDVTVINPFDFQQKRYNNDLWVEYKQELTDLGYAMIEYDWLMVDGLSVTIEICFDHDQRRALNSYLANLVVQEDDHVQIPSCPSLSEGKGVQYVDIPPYQAQISLVSSAGMTVTKDSLALTNGGTIFLQDGLSNDTVQWVPSEDPYEAARGVMEVDGGTEAVQRQAFLTPTDVYFELQLMNKWQRHSLYATAASSDISESGEHQQWKVALNGSFSTQVYEPMITVYDPVDVAKV